MAKQRPKASTGNAFTIPATSQILDAESRRENTAVKYAVRGVVKANGKIDRGRWNGKVRVD